MGERTCLRSPRRRLSLGIPTGWDPRFRLANSFSRSISNRWDVGQIEGGAQTGDLLNRLNEIVLGKRSITADTALRLGRFLKTSPQLWMRLQADWDLHEAMQREARKAS